AETLEDGHLGDEHVAFVNGGNGTLGFVLHAFGGVRDENTSSIDHRGGGSFTFGGGSLLSTQEAGLHRINLHDHVGKGADQLLFVRKLFAELLDGPARRLQKHFLGVGGDARFFRKHAFRRFFKRGAGEDFIGESHGCGNQGQLPAHGALHEHL